MSGFIGAMVLAASITTDTTVRAANVRDSYVQAFQRARILQHIEANLYYNVVSEIVVIMANIPSIEDKLAYPDSGCTGVYHLS